MDAQSHVIKRAQRGSDCDLDRLVALCPQCHAQTDAPYARGRLVITALGARFACEIIRGADKWANRATYREMGMQFWLEKAETAVKELQ